MKDEAQIIESDEGIPQIAVNDPYWMVEDDVVQQRPGTPIIAVAIRDDGAVWSVMTSRGSLESYAPAVWSPEERKFVEDPDRMPLELDKLKEVLQEWKKTWGDAVPADPCPSVTVTIGDLMTLGGVDPEAGVNLLGAVSDLHKEVSLLEESSDE